MPGGARRKPATQLCSSTLEELLTGYIAIAPEPFRFGIYDTLQPQKAAVGPGLVACAPFLKRWLRYFPECDVAAKQLVGVLSHLVANGCMSRFPPGHAVWSGCNIVEHKQREWWAAKVAAKLTVIFNHMRRLKGSSEKKRQAFLGVPQEGKEELECLLAMVKVEDKQRKDKKQSLNLSLACRR